MYQGEVSIGQDRLATFLAVAEDLQVKGLTNSPGRWAGPRTSHLAPHTSPQVEGERDYPVEEFELSSMSMVEQYWHRCGWRVWLVCAWCVWLVCGV